MPLILDNFEHLTSDSSCVDLIDDILQGTHKVKIIVTSREPLKLQAEWVFEVQGLPLPKSDRPEELEASSAVALFIQRATQASVGFKPTKKDLSAVVQICQLVEGLVIYCEAIPRLALEFLFDYREGNTALTYGRWFSGYSCLSPGLFPKTFKQLLI